MILGAGKTQHDTKSKCARCLNPSPGNDISLERLIARACKQLHRCYTIRKWPLGVIQNVKQKWSIALSQHY